MLFATVCRLWLFALDLPDIPGMPGRPPGYQKPLGATSPRYIEFLERNSNILYPVIAAVTIGIICLGILQAWRGHGMSASDKAALKKEIILELRKAGGGVSAEVIAKAIGMEKFATVKLLEEMHTEGLLLTYTNTQRLAMWQLKGVGQPQGGSGGAYH